MAVVNRETVPVDYAVRVTEFIAGTDALVRLTNGVSYTNELGNPLTREIDYYVFNVPEGSTWADFQVLNPNVNVGLLVRRTLPLPFGTNFDYRSLNPGLTNEQVIVITNSLPVPLTPGDWYLGVTHAGVAASNVSYVVLASAYSNNPPNIQWLTEPSRVRG